MKPIAILSSNFNETIQWIKRNFEIESLNISTREFTTKTGSRYIIIMKEEQVRGIHFADYIKSPDYYTLEDIVKAQVK